jgi:hypothetical protein
MANVPGIEEATERKTALAWTNARQRQHEERLRALAVFLRRYALFREAIAAGRLDEAERLVDEQRATGEP